MEKKELIPLLLKIGFSALFLYAGAVKIIDPVQFAGDIHNYQLTPMWLSQTVAIYLPWLEVIAAIAILFRRTVLGGLSAMLAMFSAFSVALSLAWLRKLDISCGCFGSARGDSGNLPLHIALLVALMAILIALLHREISNTKQV